MLIWRVTTPTPARTHRAVVGRYSGQTFRDGCGVGILRRGSGPQPHDLGVPPDPAVVGRRAGADGHAGGAAAAPVLPATVFGVVCECCCLLVRLVRGSCGMPDNTLSIPN